MTFRLENHLLDNKVLELMLYAFRTMASHCMGIPVSCHSLFYHVDIVNSRVCHGLTTAVGAWLIAIEVVLHLRV